LKPDRVLLTSVLGLYDSLVRTKKGMLINLRGEGYTYKCLSGVVD